MVEYVAVIALVVRARAGAPELDEDHADKSPIRDISAWAYSNPERDRVEHPEGWSAT